MKSFHLVSISFFGKRKKRTKSRKFCLQLSKKIEHSAKTLNVTDFRVPSWSSSERLIQVKDLFRQLKNAIKENITERFESLLEVVGFVGTAFKKLFQVDFFASGRDQPTRLHNSRLQAGGH
mgnify:CR=1 FL=1